MYDSVQTSLCKHLVAEDAVPVGYSQLTGQDQRFSVIPVIDYLLEVVLLLAFETFHSEVIYYEQVQAFDLLKELELVPFKSGQFELVHQSADSVVSDLASKPAGPFPECTGKERLAGAGWTADDDCLRISAMTTQAFQR